MPNLYPAEEELRCAKEELKLMASSEPFEKSERHWRNFVNHLDKSWVKTVKGCLDSEGKFQSIKSFVEAKRKTDPLLKYLCQARDTDNHSVQTLASLEKVSNIPVDFITMNRLDTDGNIIESTHHPLFPSRILLRAFTNRSVIHTPPQYHLGKLLRDGQDPFLVANLAIEFYDFQIREAKTRVSA